MAIETSAPRRKLSAILMVDVAGFSRMMGRDEERTTVLIREFHSRTKGAVEAHEGRVVDTAGDSVFGEFDSVIHAVRCAQAIQEAQAAVNTGRAPAERIQTRIGVHLGDVIVQDYQVYGDGVNIAARLQSLAEPGTICVSEAVYQQVYKKLDLAFEDLGLQELKNIEHPVRLYRVVLADSTGNPQAADERPRANAAPQPAALAWKDALLHPSSLVPLMLGVYFMATVFGLPPSGRLFPSIGAVLTAVGVGRALRLRTGRRAFFLIALGPGLMLAALLSVWRGESPSWWLLIAGIVVVTIGLTTLRKTRPVPSVER
jgi:class 3 adenylate cyclase